MHILRITASIKEFSCLLLIKMIKLYFISQHELSVQKKNETGNYGTRIYRFGIAWPGILGS